jgi:hypothetical protein
MVSTHSDFSFTVDMAMVAAVVDSKLEEMSAVSPTPSHDHWLELLGSQGQVLLLLLLCGRLGRGQFVRLPWFERDLAVSAETS